jgi:hypothetical protein
VNPRADVIHDPQTDWCACEPYGMNRCDYRFLADAVADAFNPPDNDAAEVSIMVDAVARAREYIAGQPCTCTPAMIEDREPCPRCTALGRLDDKPLER